MKSIIYSEMKNKKKIQMAKKELNAFLSEKHLTDIFNLNNFEIQIACALMIHRDFDVSRAWQVIIEGDFTVYCFDYETYLEARCEALDDLKHTEEDISDFIRKFVFLEYKFDLSILNDEEWRELGNIDSTTCKQICGDFTSGYQRDETKAQGLIKINDIRFYSKFYDTPILDEEINYYKKL